MPTQKLRVRKLKREDEQAIARRLKELDGVFHATLNHGDECAEIDFEDDRVSLDQIKAAIAEFGYRAEVAG